LFVLPFCNTISVERKNPLIGFHTVGVKQLPIGDIWIQLTD